ncbi:diaminopimelate decarboxylase [Leucobacter massiliensis]|uniref:Diaminopimelate decarboxylase n=1 Tax=Leucobacter massiliensis TaxID=1686285 RepID=A0A2S9QSR9_9MICO|nr:diaminopimelate decarboxylase [Leucobacter massiliensis]PRI12646.1 diaminopimelate decarboxylase [Leucobacter massiliensis]
MTELDLAGRRELILRAAIAEGLVDRDREPVAAFLDLGAVAANVAALHQGFAREAPHADALHAFAAKANCLVPVLGFLREQGMGCEVASLGELAQAEAAGFPAERIVFDSPAKTMRELRHALRLGATVNADNFQELERIAAILAEHPSPSRIGVRLNPQVGLGGIAAMSTAGATTKFGVPLRDPGNRERLLAWYRSHPWLTAVHAHIGSQGCPPELVAAGLREVLDFAAEVDAQAGRRQIRAVDIGGGLPVDFSSDAAAMSPWGAYFAQLRDALPELFDGRYTVITEFGRAVTAKHGFIAAHVEYTKSAGGRPIAVTHAGAQLATRTVFMPEAWPIRVVAHHPDGRHKAGETIRQDVAGPCCFAGDLIATDRELPPLVPGDLVTLLDTGAYYFSTPFSYNSLLEPGVYGARIDEDGRVRFSTIRAPQSIAELLRRTGGDPAQLSDPGPRADAPPHEHPAPTGHPVTAHPAPSEHPALLHHSAATAP